MGVGWGDRLGGGRSGMGWGHLAGQEGHGFRQWRGKIGFLLGCGGTVSNCSFSGELTSWFLIPLCSYGPLPVPPTNPGGGFIKGLTWGLAHQYLQREKITLRKGDQQKPPYGLEALPHLNNSDPAGPAKRVEAGRANHRLSDFPSGCSHGFPGLCYFGSLRQAPNSSTELFNLEITLLVAEHSSHLWNISALSPHASKSGHAVRKDGHWKAWGLQPIFQQALPDWGLGRWSRRWSLSRP